MLNKLKLPSSLPFLTQTCLGFPFKNIYLEFDFRKRPLTVDGNYNTADIKIILI